MSNREDFLSEGIVGDCACGRGTRKEHIDPYLFR
jgi:hypothetical protein